MCVNIQGLRGKHAYVEDQLAWRKSQIVFFQETKDAGGVLTARRFLRLASPARSHWGTAIWLNRCDGAFELDGKAIIIEEDDISVLFNAKRLLMIQIVTAGLRVTLFAAHCPHEGRNQERQQFLRVLDKLLSDLKPCDLIIGGIDAHRRTSAKSPARFSSVSRTVLAST